MSIRYTLLNSEHIKQNLNLRIEILQFSISFEVDENESFRQSIYEVISIYLGIVAYGPHIFLSIAMKAISLTEASMNK